jgi:hypothetical protein
MANPGDLDGATVPAATIDGTGDSASEDNTSTVAGAAVPATGAAAAISRSRQCWLQGTLLEHAFTEFAADGAIVRCNLCHLTIRCQCAFNMMTFKTHCNSLTHNRKVAIKEAEDTHTERKNK